MEAYKKLVMELLEEHITETIEYNHNHGDHSETRESVLRHLNEYGFEDIFGNMTGSRTCNTYEAQKFIDESGAIWDEDILDLFAEIDDDYFTETLKRGPETLDVVICELLASRLLWDMATESGVEL